jgi:excisionase family DNA binding protein
MKYTKYFYTPHEVAEMAGLSSATILNYISSGKLHAVKLSERTYRIPVRSVVQMLNPELLAPSTRTQNFDVDIESEVADELLFEKIPA